jgi:carbamoyl-phosphate synthase large subunit
VFEADEKNLEGFWCEMIGVDVNAINITEDREQFKQLLKNVPSAPAEICTSYLRKEIAQEFGFHW